MAVTPKQLMELFYENVLIKTEALHFDYVSIKSLGKT